jgi:DNA mismatch repair ATPase MutL
MKSKELRKIIREAITDVLAEDANKIKALKLKATQLRQQAIDAEQAASTEEERDLQQDKTAMAEAEIDEMARIPKGYRLTNDNIDTTPFTKTISGTSLADVINYFRENPGTDKKALQTQFNFARPQIANAIVNGLMDAGVLTKLGAGGEEEASGVQAQAPAATDAEDMFVGGAENPLAMYFDGEPNDDGSEDMVEPEAGEIERAPMAGQLSDEDFEAFLKASTLEDRIAKVKSDILKTRRSKSGGEFETEPSTEVQRLRDLKVTLEKRLADLVAGSKYLQKRSGVEPEDIEMPDTEEEPLDEWAIGKAQYYAGIKK